MSAYNIYIVEDDPWYGEILDYHLSLNPDYKVTRFESGKDVLAKMHLKPDLVTIDFSLPDIEGDELFKRIREASPNVPVIVISSQEEVTVAVNLLKMGVNDYLVKDEATKDLLWNSIIRIRETQSLKKEVEQLREELGQKFSFQKTMIGQSESLKKVFTLIGKAVKTNINILINGETGTGKEVVAKAIHYNSDRKKKSFVAVNMAAIPKELIESELFGHEKGSFTSAIKQRIGKFEQANGGTLFLDEIGDMSLSAQAKVLRALQEGKITRVGADKDIAVDVRVIAATNKDLLLEVEQKNFRLDLYHRLGVIIIHVPSLNERKEDIPQLVKYFLQTIAVDYGQPPKEIQQEAIQALQEFQWTGNVRELRNVVERLIILSGKIITTEDVTAYVQPRR